MIHILPLAVAALGGLAGARLLRGGSLGSPEAAERAWHAAYPGDAILEVACGTDRRSALVRTEWGCGLVARNGRVARRLDRATVRHVPGGLQVQFPEPGARPITVPLPEAVADRWLPVIAAEG
jgi:hypothetical protein